MYLCVPCHVCAPLVVFHLTIEAPSDLVSMRDILHIRTMMLLGMV